MANDMEVDDVGDDTSIRQFQIPRKKPKEGELWAEAPITSRTFKEDLLPLITRNMSKPANKDYFKFEQGWLVHNATLKAAYQEKRGKIKQEYGLADKEVSDSIAFILVSDEQQAKLLCTDGVCIGNLPQCTIGVPNSGACACRYADILRPSVLPTGMSFYLVILKFIKGKVNFVVESDLGEESVLEPDPQSNCHMSERLANPTGHFESLDSAKAFYSSQVYLYEYSEDADLILRPRQILPYGVVKLTYTGNSRLPAVRPIMSTLLAVSTASASASDGNQSWGDEEFTSIWKGPLRVLRFTTGFPSKIRIHTTLLDTFPIAFYTSPLKELFPGSLASAGLLLDTSAAHAIDAIRTFRPFVCSYLRVHENARLEMAKYMNFLSLNGLMARVQVTSCTRPSSVAAYLVPNTPELEALPGIDFGPDEDQHLLLWIYASSVEPTNKPQLVVKNFRKSCCMESLCQRRTEKLSEHLDLEFRRLSRYLKETAAAAEMERRRGEQEKQAKRAEEKRKQQAEAARIKKLAARRKQKTRHRQDMSVSKDLQPVVDGVASVEVTTIGEDPRLRRRHGSKEIADDAPGSPPSSPDEADGSQADVPMIASPSGTDAEQMDVDSSMLLPPSSTELECVLDVLMAFWGDRFADEVEKVSSDPPLGASIAETVDSVTGGRLPITRERLASILQLSNLAEMLNSLFKEHVERRQAVVSGNAPSNYKPYRDGEGLPFPRELCQLWDYRRRNFEEHPLPENFFDRVDSNDETEESIPSDSELASFAHELTAEKGLRAPLNAITCRDQKDLFLKVLEVVNAPCPATEEVEEELVDEEELVNLLDDEGDTETSVITIDSEEE